MEAFANRTREIAEKLSRKAVRDSIVYSTACYNHHISEKAGFFDVRTSSGVSEGRATAMLLRRALVKEPLVDECEGFACGTGCGAGRLAVV